MTPRLTDRAALARHRRRRRPDAEFVHQTAISEIEGRLAEVNRTFTAPAVVTGAPDIWSAAFPEARIVEDCETLDLQPGAHDLVLHAMGLHWADDPVGQLVQCRRALRPDGLCLAVCPGGQTLQELRAVLAEAESELAGGLSPRVVPMADIRDLGGLLQRAGFALPVADLIRQEVTYRSARHLMRDLRAMGEANALADRNKRPLTRTFFDRVEDIYARHFPASGDRVRATLELVFLAGWAPSDIQPRPLRPGSAQRRLADALGTEERGSGEAAPRQTD